MVYTVLVYIGMRMFGLTGVGMAFLGLYLFYTVLMVSVSRRLTGFRWSEVNSKILKWSVPCVVAVFLATRHLRPLWANVLGLSAVLAGGFVCLRMLWPLLPREKKRVLEAKIGWLRR
jgi:PST family polysaccharide transporter